MLFGQLVNQLGQGLGWTNASVYSHARLHTHTLTLAVADLSFFGHARQIFPAQIRPLRLQAAAQLTDLDEACRAFGQLLGCQGQRAGQHLDTFSSGLLVKLRTRQIRGAGTRQFL